MSKENFIPERLRNNYITLKKYPWVEDPNLPLTQDDVDVLQQLLNESQPQNQNEVIAKEAIRYLFNKNRNEFYVFMRNNRTLSLIFWTDAGTILGHFKLNKRVFMKWQEDKYVIGLKERAEE